MIRLFFAILLTLSIVTSSHLKAQESTPEKYKLSSSQKGIKVSSDIFAAALPVGALTVAAVTQDWKGVKQLAFAGATALGTTMILKYTIHNKRPDNSDSHSMPSGHTASAFVSAAFLQRRYGWSIGAPAFAIATYTGWARIYAKRHDFWDVLAGGAIGAVSAYIYTRPFAQKHELSISPITDGRNFIVSTSFTF